MAEPEGFIPPHGNYRELLSCQKAEAVYGITYRFCHKYLKKGDRTLGAKPSLTHEDFREFPETRSPETAANIAPCLIHQANYLLDQQMRRLEQDFPKQGGLRERMTRAPLQARKHPSP
jgi:four helix bundle suffix protein